MAEKKRILIFSLAYVPFIGGAELAVKEIADRLPEGNFTMITANLDDRQPSEEQIGNVHVHRLRGGRLSKYFYPLHAVQLAEALHAQAPFDQVWAIMANQAGFAALRFKRRHPQVQYLLTLQEGDSVKKIWSRTWWMRPAYKAIYRKANAIQAISSFLANRAIHYGFTGAIHVIPNGVNLEHFRQPVAADTLAQLRRAHGVPADQPVVMSVSRLVIKNGPDRLIRAMQGVPARLLLLGIGNQEDRLRSLSLDLGLSDRVIFVGHIDHALLPAYLRLATVFARPSRSEGLGSAFIEAMAAGVPVVATNVGGIPDIITDGVNGLFCDGRNPRDLGDKINLLLHDPALRQRLIHAGQDTASRYEWSSIVDKMRPLLGL